MQMKLRKLAMMSSMAVSLAFAGVAVAQQAKPAAGQNKAPAAGSTTTSTAKPAASDGEENVQYKAKTVYDFEDDMVEGDLQRPDGELIDSVRKAKHSSLIEIRKDFIPEMLKSLEDV
jgi:hypothetical protein